MLQTSATWSDVPLAPERCNYSVVTLCRISALRLLVVCHCYRSEGNVSGYEQLARDAYNNGVKVAYRCVGWEYVGLLTAIANETRGTPEWSAYYAEAASAIDAFFKSGSAWVEFDSYVLEPAQEYLK